MPRPRPDDDRGAVAILVAAFMTVFMGLAAIIVDLGYARDQQRVAQNAADAAALAVASCFAAPTGCAKDPNTLAQNYVTANGWTATGTTVALDTTARTVKVSLPGQKSVSFFSGVIGGGAATVGGAASASWGQSAAPSCVLCVLTKYDGQTGDAFLGGPILVNGNIEMVGNGSITVTTAAPVDPSQAIAMTGTADAKGTYTVNGAQIKPATLSVPFADPFKDNTKLPLPPVSGPGLPVDLTKAATSGSGAGCAPGVYIDFSNCTNLTGNGIYIVTGDGGKKDTEVQIPGTDTPNALIYLTCATSTGGKKPVVRYQECKKGDPGATFGGAGKTNTVLHRLVAPGSPYDGFAVIYDRNRTATEKYAGNGEINLDGTFYGASVVGQFKGNGAGHLTGNGNMVIGTVTFAGNHDHLDIPGNGTPVVVGAPLPAHLIP